MNHAQAIDALRAVLCDPSGKCCIDGSEGDRQAVDEALTALTALRSGGGEGEPIGWVFQHADTGHMSFCQNDGVNTPQLFQRINPRHKLVSPAYPALPHPQPARGEAVAWMHDVVASDGEPDQALSFSCDSFPLEGVAGYRTISVRPLYAHPQAQSSGQGECGDGAGLADCPFCGGPPAYVGGETAGYEVRCGHCGGGSGWGDYGYQASAKWNRRAAYSLDADPRGIRSAAADAITGALAFGAQGNNRPPNGHWLLPFWEAARADAAPPAAQPAEAVCTCPSGDGSLRWPCPQHPAQPAEAGKVRGLAGLQRAHGRLANITRTRRAEFDAGFGAAVVTLTLEDAETIVQQLAAALAEQARADTP